MTSSKRYPGTRAALGAIEYALPAAARLCYGPRDGLWQVSYTEPNGGGRYHGPALTFESALRQGRDLARFGGINVTLRQPRHA